MSSWRKSRFCEQFQCVEVWPEYRVWVRDSTQPQVVLSFDRAAWQALMRDLRVGRVAR